jgi:hypothetical protein
MRIDLDALALLALALPAVATGQSPVEALRPADRPGELRLELRAAAVTALADLQRVEIASFPLSDGSRADLELVRLDLAQLQLGVYVDGEPAPGLLEGLDLSVWRGRVADDGDSRVALSFSQAGAHGWVQADGALHHLISRGADEVRIVSDDLLAELVGERGLTCAADELLQDMPEARPRRSAGGKADGGRVGGGRAGAPSLYVCSVAIETDWQLNQVFGGDLLAETAYVTSLLTWVSYRYEEQVATVLTYPYVQFYTTPNDPWHTPDVGGFLSCIDLLYELQAAWGSSVPAGAQLAHFLSGADLGCGAAFIGGLCDVPRNFGVTGNIDGQTQFPIQVSPSNLNFYGVTHEIGHNFDAIHTHAYCPPIDECAPSGYFGPCQTQKVCTTEGTLMSYCHGCPGGFQNITTYFHPQSVADMRARVEATCLPLYAPDPVPYCVSKPNSQGCAPVIGWEGHATLSGLDDFAVTAAQVINNQNGLLFWGPGAASTPFQGGTLCVASPITRTTLQASGGSPPPGSDCTGTYRLPWTHAQLASLGAGNTVYAQYWYRDAPAQGGSGLSNALAFTIHP